MRHYDPCRQEEWGKTGRPEPPHGLHRLSAVLYRSRVESAAGAVAVGQGVCCFPAAFAICRCLSPGPWLRFPLPLIEPDLRISRIRLSDRLHERACAELPLALLAACHLPVSPLVSLL